MEGVVEGQFRRNKLAGFVFGQSGLRKDGMLTTRTLQSIRIHFSLSPDTCDKFRLWPENRLSFPFNASVESTKKRPLRGERKRVRTNKKQIPQISLLSPRANAAVAFRRSLFHPRKAKQIEFTRSFSLFFLRLIQSVHKHVKVFFFCSLSAFHLPKLHVWIEKDTAHLTLSNKVSCFAVMLCEREMAWSRAELKWLQSLTRIGPASSLDRKVLLLFCCCTVLTIASGFSGSSTLLERQQRAMKFYRFMAHA